MWSQKPCPWRHKNLAFPVQLGVRLPEHSIRWYQFTLSEKVTRGTTVCPYCNQAIRQDVRSQRWVLLVFPFLIANLVEIYFLPRSVIPVWLWWGFVFLAVSGGLLMSAISRFEKVLEDERVYGDSF